MTLDPLKRIEIVIDSLHLPRTLEAVRAAGVPGYTVLPNVAGWGDRGEQRADELSDASSNAYVLIAAEPEEAERVARAVQPLLRTFGGICLISDCQGVPH